MNSAKERLSTALSHREPDRPPMMMSASEWVIARLKRHVGVETDRELHRALSLDIYDTRGFDYKGAIAPKFLGPEELNIPADWKGDLFDVFNYHEHVTENEYGKAYSMGSPCFGAAEYPTIEALERYPWPQVDWFDFSDIRRQVEEWADEFAVMASGASVFQHATLYRGMEELLFEMAAEPERAEYVLDRVSEFYCGFFERFFEEAGDLIDIFRLADDIGAQDSLFVSPRMLDRFLGERIRRCADLAHAYDIRLLLHSDGNIYDAIPSLIEWGVDILDPVQPEVPAMNHRRLKREFGDRVSFSGGVGAQEILPRGTVHDVKEETRRAVAELGAGGGYILSPGHPSLQMDVPPENIVAMYEAGLESLEK
jgi:uroporphyrinogen decarboxylase